VRKTYPSYLKILPLGLAIIGFGIFLSNSFIKRNEPYRTALLPSLSDNFDPMESKDVNKTTVLSQVCSRLTSLAEDLQLYPDLAESWTIDAARKVYTFKIAKGRKTSDGIELNAQDAKFSLMRFAHATFRKSWIDEIEKIDAPDPHTLVLSLKGPNPQFLGKLSHPVFCILSAKMPFQKRGAISYPNSAGAYFVGLSEEQTLTLHANESFPYEHAEKVIEVEFQPQDKAIDLFKRGLLNDLSFYLLSDAEIESLGANKRLIRLRLFWSWLIQLNTTKPPFSQKHLRRDFFSHFSMPDFVKTWDESLVPSSGAIPNGLMGFERNIADRVEGTAKVPCEQVTVAAIKGMPNESNLQSAVRNYFGPALDCEFDLEFLEMGHFHEAIAQKTYDIYISGVSSQSEDPLQFFRFFIENQGENRLKFSDQKLDILFKNLSSKPIELRTLEDYRQVNQAFEAANFARNIGSPEFSFAFTPDVKAVQLSPLGMAFNQWYKIGRK
jgi:MarR-like DNA-binding transcriptional regulator SgrR of sgrS sRNA